MADDTRPARAAEQADPALNPQFRRTWVLGQVTGPDVPSRPAHPYAWHAPSTYAWERAASEFSRIVGAGR